MTDLTAEARIRAAAAGRDAVGCDDICGRTATMPKTLIATLQRYPTWSSTPPPPITRSSKPLGR